MMMYAIFVSLTIISCGIMVYGIQTEMQLWSLVGPMLGIPGFLPESLGWFIISYFFMFFVVIGIFIRIKTSGCSKRFDKIPLDKGLFNFIYRDGICTDLIGSRRPGMGVFDLPEVGVVVDTGRLPNPGSVYHFGKKNIRFALQDISFTPNPKFTSIYSFFTNLGFNSMEELQDVLNGYNPALMVRVWNKLVEYTPQTSADRVVENIQNMDKRELKMNDKLWDAKPQDEKHEELEGFFKKLKGKGKGS